MRRQAVSGVVLGLAMTVGSAMPAAANGGDPLERVNRYTHGFNTLLRVHVLTPAARLYVEQVPAEVRQGIGQALANLGEPVTAIAGLAGGEFAVAGNALQRFGINTVLGYGGVRDVARERGLPPRPYGLADAACGWGVPSGPYLVLPVLGPSTLRDAAATFATGLALSQAVGPEVVLGWQTGSSFHGYAEMHRSLDSADAQAIDPYAMQRSAHLQRRALACPGDGALQVAAGMIEEEE
ncbi:VacJ family lipoprotein [Roseomonas stagni]|uniref:VacJ family lipoprotein n=1 Tax=Falsiroseomonas algicola TaxID=2716930 RepID=A0A6M1LK88_9PROT|nr:VacJ family lipoprotein [Falsiroseomonas algicola]NGM20389.1 VacJ family lipoprotein [Falsiroseomonas algicola]